MRKSNIDDLLVKLSKIKEPNQASDQIINKIKSNSFNVLLAQYGKFNNWFFNEKCLFPSSFNEIAISRLTPTNKSFTKELHWSILPIFAYASKINKFCEHKQKFDNAFLQGDIQLAEKLYSEILDIYGLSFWSIDAGFLIKSYGQSLQKNRQFLEYIKERSAENGFISIYAEYVSMRIEINVSNYTFNRHIESLCDYDGEDNSIKQAYSFLKTCWNFSNVVNNDSLYFWGVRDLPLIDRYLLLIRTLQIIYSSIVFKPEQQLLAKTIKKLVKRIDDPLLKNLNQLISPMSPQQHNQIQESLLKIVHNHTSGEYEKVQEESLKLITDNPDCLDFLELYINSAIHSKITPRNPFQDNSLASDIYQKMYSIKVKDKDSESSFDALLKISNILGSSKLSNSIIAFVRNNKHNNSKIDNSIFEILNYSVLTPRFSIGFKRPDDSLRFLKNLSNRYPNNSAISLYEYEANQRKTKKILAFNINVPEIRKEKHLAYGLKCSGNYEDASQKYYSLYLATKDDPLNHAESLRYLTECYLALKQYQKWLHVVVDTYLRSPDLLLPINLLQLHESIKNKSEVIDQNEICWPIYYSILYSEDLLPIDYMYLYQFYDDFMLAKKFNKIEQFLIPTDEYLNKRFIYFLKNVCIPNVIDNSVKFKNTEELEASLIIKFQILQQADSQNGELYLSEIRKITQSSMIRKSIQRINQSRIHVDISNVKASLDMAFPDNFKRYADYLGLQDYLRQTLKVLNILIVILTEKKPQQYEDAAFQLFCELFDEIKKKYIANLDSYLSTRIRHGTLSGQIRSVFEKEKLITQNKMGVYESNDYWLSKLVEEDSKTSGEINDYLNCFSKNIDEIIDKMKSKWIQIKTKEKSEGLFDFNFSIESLNQIYDSLMIENINSDIFFDNIIRTLNSQTVASLDLIRKNISDFIKPELVNSINELGKFVESKLKSKAKRNVIDAISRCRTNIPICLAIVEDWFDGIGEQTAPDFHLNHLLDTVIEIISNGFQRIQFRPHRNIPEDCKLKGTYFNALIDIFFTISENAVKHAQNQLNTVNITIKKENEFLKIIISNKINEDMVEELQKKLDSIKSKLATEDISDLIRREGGSGLYKINRILQNIHLNPTESYGFGIRKNLEDNIFEIWINLNLQEILA